MLIVYKHQLKVQHEPQKLQFHEAHKILAVGMQQGKIQLWVREWTQGPLVDVEFLVAGTGWELPGGELMYLGSTGIDNGSDFVWHVFQTKG